jgi:hypothetical protein
MTGTDSLVEISSEAELRELLGYPAKLWRPDTWRPDALPSHAQMVKSLQACEETLEELERYYGPEYETRIYG